MAIRATSQQIAQGRGNKDHKRTHQVDSPTSINHDTRRECRITSTPQPRQAPPFPPGGRNVIPNRPQFPVQQGITPTRHVPKTTNHQTGGHITESLPSPDSGHYSQCPTPRYYHNVAFARYPQQVPTQYLPAGYYFAPMLPVPPAPCFSIPPYNANIYDSPTIHNSHHTTPPLQHSSTFISTEHATPPTAQPPFPI